MCFLEIHIILLLNYAKYNLIEPNQLAMESSNHKYFILTTISTKYQFIYNSTLTFLIYYNIQYFQTKCYIIPNVKY